MFSHWSFFCQKSKASQALQGLVGSTRSLVRYLSSGRGWELLRSLPQVEGVITPGEAKAGAQRDRSPAQLSSACLSINRPEPSPISHVPRNLQMWKYSILLSPFLPKLHMIFPFSHFIIKCPQLSSLTWVGMCNHGSWKLHEWNELLYKPWAKAWASGGMKFLVQSMQMKWTRLHQRTSVQITIL